MKSGIRQPTAKAFMGDDRNRPYDSSQVASGGLQGEEIEKHGAKTDANMKQGSALR